MLQRHESIEAAALAASPFFPSMCLHILLIHIFLFGCLNKSNVLLRRSATANSSRRCYVSNDHFRSSLSRCLMLIQSHLVPFHLVFLMSKNKQLPCSSCRAKYSPFILSCSPLPNRFRFRLPAAAYSNRPTPSRASQPPSLRPSPATWSASTGNMQASISPSRCRSRTCQSAGQRGTLTRLQI